MLFMVVVQRCMDMLAQCGMGTDSWDSHKTHLLFVGVCVCACEWASLSVVYSLHLLLSF
jgi:hypothetical protein